MIKNKEVIRIGIQIDVNIYHATSLYFLADGSFKVDVPHCNHEEGLVLTIPHPDNYKDDNGNKLVPLSDSKQIFFLKNRPQLSIHSSGLVQFSGKGINSGVEASTGKSKGAALYSQPLKSPISSGPTCSVVMWGLKEGYKKIEPNTKNLIVYKPNDFVKFPYLKEGVYDSYSFNFWIFKTKLIPESARTTSDPSYFTFKFSYYNGCTLSMRTFELPNTELSIGIIPLQEDMMWAKKAGFGFYLSSPMGLEKKDTNISLNNMYSLHAFSPPFDFDGYLKKDNLPSLDFQS